jgi:5-methylcytosine-specific restriction endonuclease McrA
MNVNQVKAGINTKDPYEIAKALTLPLLTAQNIHPNPNPKKRSYSERLTIDGTDWSPVLNSFLEARDHVFSGDAISCFAAQSTFHSSLNHLLHSSPGNILVPLVHTCCRSTHHIAVQADHIQALTSKRNDHARLQSAVTLLQESFSKTLNDRSELVPGAPLSVDGSKKVGVLYIVNQLFAMYFRLNTLRLCKNLLRPVESRNLHKTGNMGDMVTYRYFVGRLNMFEDSYELAEENLSFALQHCHKDAVGNKKRILNYLIPVKLMRGRLPSTKILEKYNLVEYIPFVIAIRRGDLRTFHKTLQENQDEFIRRGTYLLLEKCKTVCHRNLFKRIHLIMDIHQIPLDNVVKTIRWMGMDMDLDEVECVLANLIFRGIIKGYISHSKRILVLSKRDPFPTAAVVK